MSTKKDENIPLTKEIPIVKEMKAKETSEDALKIQERNINDDFQFGLSQKDEVIPMLLSSKDLKEIYEKKKRLKDREELFHFKDVHPEKITSMVVTPDNRYILSGSQDKSIKVYDLATKEQVHHFENAHEGPILSMTITSDNRSLVSGSSDGSIKVFDLNAKEQVLHFENVHQNRRSAIAVSPDCKSLVSSSNDRSIKVFDLNTKQLVHHFEKAHSGEITCVAISSENKYILSGSMDMCLKVFDLTTKQLIHHFEKVHPGYLTCVIVSLDNRYIISATNDGSIQVFDFATKQLVHRFEKTHKKPINSMALTSDSKYLISGSEDQSIKIFDLYTKQQVHNFVNAHLDSISSVAVSSDNKYIISGSADRSIKIFEIAPQHQIHHFENAHQSKINSLALSSNNKYIISGSEDKSIKVHDLTTKQQVHHFENAHQKLIIAVAVTPNNKYIISGSYDKSIKVYDLNTKQQVHHFENAHEQLITSLAVTPNSRFIISSALFGSIKVFDLETKQQVHHFEKTHQGKINSLAISSNSRYLISGSGDKSIKVHDLNTKQQVHHFENAHKSHINSVTITSDNKYIVSADHDNSIKIFDLATKQQVHYFENAHRFSITSVVVTADNKFLISASWDRSIKVFDLAIKQQIHHFENIHKHTISSLAVTSDNKYIISGSYDQSIKMLEFQANKETDRFQNLHLKGDNNISSSTKSHNKSSKVFDLHTRQQENGNYCSIRLNPSFQRLQKAVLLTLSRGITCFDIRSQSSQPRTLFQYLNLSKFHNIFSLVFEGTRKFSFFNSVDEFLFDKPVEFSVSEAVTHPEIFVLPFGWNILHIMSVSGNYNFIQKMPDYSKFKMPFLVDAFNNTPLHYLVAHKNVDYIAVNILFEYICDYLKDFQFKNPFEFQNVIKSLSSLLPLIFRKIKTELRQRFLRIIYSESSLPFNDQAPIFGSILSKSAAFCNLPVLTQETREKIWNDQGNTQIEFQSNYLYLDYDVLSQDMREMIDSLKQQTNQDIFKLPSITRVINHLWEQAETVLRIFFVIYSLFIIALSVYLTVKDSHLSYEILLLVSSVLLTINESLQLWNLKKSYWKNFWNWFDLVHLLFTITFLLMRISKYDNRLIRAWMPTMIVIFGYLRWISLLKIFKPTRNLIQAVIVILKDMVSFVIIIALIIIGFSLIFLVFNWEDGYGTYLYEAYNVLYGPMDIDEYAPWPFSQKLLMAVLAFFLNVVLLNLLISIMADSYSRVLEMRDRSDVLTRLEMISEAAIYKKIWKPNHQTKRGYLVYCQPIELEGDENDQNTALEAGIQIIKKLIQQNSESSNQEIKKIQKCNEVLAADNKDLKADNEILKGEVSNLKTEILNLKTYLENEFSKMKTDTVIKNNFSKSHNP